MANTIKLRKGLNINLQGRPEDVSLKPTDDGLFALVPDGFEGITPKVAVKEGDKDIAKMRESYDMRRKFLMRQFEIMGLPCFEPYGAFYVFPSIQEFGMTSDEFCTRLLMEEKLAVVPGTAFGDCGEGFVRISYAYSIDELREAISRIQSFITRLRAK